MDAPDTHEEAEARFLAELRERVAWQSREAARLRAEVPSRPAPLDVLDMASLHRLVDAHADRPRVAEWRTFLAELDILTDASGRLPDQLERLVRVVLAELLA